MIKTTLGALDASLPAMAALMGEKLPIKVAYHVTKLAKRIPTELTLFGEKRTELLKEANAEPEPGDNTRMRIPADKAEAFSSAWTELSSIEVSIDLNQLTLDSLDGAKLSSVQIESLVAANIVTE